MKLSFAADLVNEIQKFHGSAGSVVFLTCVEKEICLCLILIISHTYSTIANQVAKLNLYGKEENTGDLLLFFNTIAHT